jgi:prepilin-type N-terminal cleavage/methylation domain-containing protein
MMKEGEGFTLVELLVGLTIFSVVVISLYSAFSTGILARRKGGNASDSFQTARVALNDIGSELKKMVPYSGYGLIGRPEELSFPVVDFQTEGELRLSRITYSLKENSDLKALIKKREILVGELSLAYELAPRVKELSFHYAFLDSLTDSLQWKATWSCTDTLPQALKTVLTLQTRGKDRAITFTKVVALPLSQ